MPVDTNNVPDNRVRAREIQLQRQVTAQGKRYSTSATLQLLDGIDPSYIYVTPGASLDLRLPEPREGMLYFVMHIGASNTITVKDHKGTAQSYVDSSAVTLTTGQFFTAHYVEGAWINI